MSITQIALAGLDRVQENVERVAQRLAKTDVSAEAVDAGDIVDLSSEMVTLSGAELEYAALAKAMEAEKKMSERLIDLLG